MSKLLDNIDDLILKHGLAVLFVAPRKGESGLPFSYTVGLADRRQPEIIVFGLSEETGRMLLNAAASLQSRGALETDRRMDKIANMPVVFKRIPLDSARAHMPIAFDRHPECDGVLQLVWPDKEGKFPWEADFNPALMDIQKLLF